MLNMITYHALLFMLVNTKIRSDAFPDTQEIRMHVLKLKIIFLKNHDAPRHLLQCIISNPFIFIYIVTIMFNCKIYKFGQMCFVFFFIFLLI